jgi:hypothetical protein
VSHAFAFCFPSFTSVSQSGSQSASSLLWWCDQRGSVPFGSALPCSVYPERDSTRTLHAPPAPACLPACLPVYVPASFFFFSFVLLL